MAKSAETTTRTPRSRTGLPSLETAGSLLRRIAVRERLATRWGLALTFLAGLGWALVLLVRSPGAPRHDEIAHYLIARHAWTTPLFILDEWGKVGYNLIYLLPSAFGWPASRIFSLGLSCLTVLFAARLAKQLGADFFWLVPLFCWFQPWFARLSFTALTETPFSLLGVGGASLALDGRLGLAALAVGLLPLVRHEGLLFVVLFILVCAARRRWLAAATSVGPVAVYNGVAKPLLGRWPIADYVRPSQPDVFNIGSGDWLFYFGRLPEVAGAPVTLLAALGLAAVFHRRARLLLLVGCAVYIAVHTVVYRYSMWAAGGEERYLMPLAPFIAVSAALGLGTMVRMSRRYTFGRGRRTMPMLLAGTVFTVVAAGLLARPHRIDPEQATMREAAAWLQQQGHTPEQVVSTHVWFYYYYPLRATRERSWSHPPRLETLGDGAVVVWDAHYSEVWGLSSASLTAPESGWTLLREYAAGEVKIFRKLPGDRLGVPGARGGATR